MGHDAMSVPVAKGRDLDVLKFFCKHLVGLCITFRRPSESQRRFVAYAGTLIRLGDSIHFLTAGHNIRQIEEELSKVEVESAVLADTFGQRSVSDHPIPFDLKSAPRFFIDDEDDGLDFGLIGLRPYYVRLLAANGMVALEEENWAHQASITFDGYVMLGLPLEYTSQLLADNDDGLVSPTMFRVKALEPSSPKDTKQTRYPRFAGKIDTNLPLKDLRGMSGGPILGFNLGPPMRYWIVALQSTWKKDRHEVYGCPVPVFASLVTEWMKEFDSSD